MTSRLRRLSLAAVTFVVTSCLLVGGLLYLRSRKPPLNFLVDQAHYYMADAIAGHLHRPHATLEVVWPEHPKGKILIRTNNLGFRGDSDTAIKKANNTVRILVTGDSHTDGVVYNAESFPNLLENKLNASSTFNRFEVINGGVGYYTFQNYAGFLNKHLDMKPDYFMVVVYLGNDFMEGIEFATKQGKIAGRTRSIWYRLKLRWALSQMVSQAGNQLAYFDTYPEMKERALEIAREQLKDIEVSCRQNRIQLIVALLPTRLDVDDQARRDAGRGLRLTDSQLDVNQELKRSLIRALSDDHVSFVDLTDHMKGKSYGLFWNQDYHLGDKGHRVVADVLFEELASGLIERSATTNEAGRK